MAGSDEWRVFGQGPIGQRVDEDAGAAGYRPDEGEVRAIGRWGGIARVIQQGHGSGAARVDLFDAALVLGLGLAGHRNGGAQVGALVQDPAAVGPDGGQVERLGAALAREQ